MKVTGFLVALAAAAPMVSAIPFKMGDLFAPLAARAPAPVEAPTGSFPQFRPTNLTARGTNETVVDKRAFLPQGSDDKAKRDLHNGIEFVQKRTNYTFKA